MTTAPAEPDYTHERPHWHASHSTQIQRVTEWDAELASADPLRFPGYCPPEPGSESVWTGVARIGGRSVALVECRFDNVGGTMGVVAGERLVRAFGRAAEAALPVVELVSSGGARLQEGVFALVQMARTASAVEAHRRAGLLSVAVLRSPTTGGVYASWASLADLRAARSGAVIGFGGPRVVTEVTGKRPPESSHTAESAYAAGMVDTLVDHDEEATWIAAALGEIDTPTFAPPLDVDRAFPPIPSDAWSTVRRVRDPLRPSGWDWVGWLTESWVELRGRDGTVRAGLARIGSERVMVVAMDRHARAGGTERTSPDGFRLAQRAIGLADRLGVPVLTLIDTPGAEPGPEAEVGGVAAEIAATLHALATCSSPTVAVCIGEGGSGGAMALAHADRVVLLSGAVFSVIGPEPGAVVLYRDRSRVPELSTSFGLTAHDLAAAGFADHVVDERSADVVGDVRIAVRKAFDDAAHGDRDRRIDTMTRGALRESPR